VEEVRAAAKKISRSPKALCEMTDANNDGQTAQLELNAAITVFDALPGGD
jgi:hypothetical protein